MITAEQARKNVEQHNTKVAELKRQKSEKFLGEVVEPAIVEASMHGKNETCVNFGDYLDVASDILGMISEAGFKAERGRNDAMIRVSWYPVGQETPYATPKAVVVLR